MEEMCKNRWQRLPALPFDPGADPAKIEPRSRYRTPLFGSPRPDPTATESLHPRLVWPAFPGPAHRARFTPAG